MRQIQIAVCDDEEYYRDELEKLVSVYGNESETEFVIDVYENAALLLEAFTQQGKMYDLIFFDVEMPGMTGIEAARKIYALDTEALFCFVTSHTEYALHAFEVEAIDYIVKPMKYLDVKRVMKKAMIQIYYRVDREEAKNRYLDIVSARAQVTIDLTKVIYIEKRRNQCIFHLTDGEQICYDSLGNIYKRLNTEEFVYTHQGYIANFHYIKEVRTDAVCFGSGMEIPVSRKYYQNLKERHMDKIYRIRDERKAERGDDQFNNLAQERVP